MVFGIFQMKQVAFLPRLLYLQLKLNLHCPWGQTKQLDVTSPGVAISDREAASLLLLGIPEEQTEKELETQGGPEGAGPSTGQGCSCIPSPTPTGQRGALLLL